MAEYRWSKAKDSIKYRINKRYNRTGFHLGSVKDEIYNRLRGDDPTTDIGMNAVVGAKDKAATAREYTLGNLERAVHGIDLEKTEDLLLHGKAKDIVKQGAKGVVLRSGKFALHTGVSKFEGSLDSMKGDGVEDVGIGSFAAANDKRRTSRDAVVMTRKTAQGAKFSYNYVKARHELEKAEVAQKSTPVPERPKGSRSRKGLPRKGVEARKHTREMRPHRRAVTNSRKARLRVKSLNKDVCNFLRGYSPYHNLKDTAQQTYRVGRLGKDFLFRATGIKTTSTGVGTASSEGAFSSGTVSQGRSFGFGSAGTSQTTDLGATSVKEVTDFVGKGIQGAMGSGGSSGVNPMSEMSGALRDVGKGMLAESKDMVSTSSSSSIGTSGRTVGTGGGKASRTARTSNASNRIRTRVSGMRGKATNTTSKAAGRAWQAMQRMGQGVSRLVTRLGMKVISGAAKLLANPYVLLAVVLILLLIFLLLILISTTPTQMSSAMILTDEEVFLDYRDRVLELDAEFQKELDNLQAELENKTRGGCRRTIPYYNAGVHVEYMDVSGVKTDWQALLALATVLHEQNISFSPQEEERILQLHKEMNYFETAYESVPCPAGNNCMEYTESYSCRCKTNEETGKTSCSTCHRQVSCCPGHQKATIYVYVHTLDGVIPEKDERIIDKYLVTGSQWEFEWWKQLATYDIEEQYPGVRTKITDTGLKPEGLPDDWPDQWGYPPSWPPPNGWKPAGWPLNLPFTWIHYQNF